MKDAKFLMGNEAIGLAAIRCGVRLVSGYPGTPSTEILETVAKNNPGNIHVEWSVNEKTAMEVAAAAAYAGARTMVTMKQVGLNVASDPLMSLAYVGVKGGMIVVAADDPGPISSQTEQDTRHFAQFAKLPVFDPSSPEEAYDMVEEAFALSEKYGKPVILRPTTRVCHGCASIELKDALQLPKPEGFQKDSSRWVIFPRLSFQNHQKIEAMLPEIGNQFSAMRFNQLSGEGTKGIVTAGISYEYVREVLPQDAPVRLLKIGTPHPFPEKLALQFLDGLTEVLVIEELDPVLERDLLLLCGKRHLPVKVLGKLTGDAPCAGENSVEIVRNMLSAFVPLSASTAAKDEESCPPLPVRPPVLCAGCPHRASFYAVKRAMQGKKAVFCGDIGCYTLGNAKPLDMVDTCLCMGAGVTMAQGLQRIDRDAKYFSFIGDSTFFASGLTGVVNAVYNEADLTIIVLDNSTTAMTGHQPHPGTGRTMMGNIVEKVSIPKILEAVGVTKVITMNPLKLEDSIKTVREFSEFPGVKAIIFQEPCIALVKPEQALSVEKETCIGCKKCIRELGCPALVQDGEKVAVEPSLCTGCTLCAQVCPVNAIQKNKGV